MTKATDYEPHVEAPVKDNGTVYVGRQYRGRIAEIYFRKNKDRQENNYERTDTEEYDKRKRETVEDETGDIRG